MSSGSLQLIAESTREIFWNINDVMKESHYVLSTIAILIFLAGVGLKLLFVMKGRATPLNVTLANGLITFLKDGLANLRLARRDRKSALLHLLILWSLVVLTIGTIILTIVERTHATFFRGAFFITYEITMDTFGILLIIGTAGFLYWRYISRIERFKRERHGNDDLIVTLTLLIIALTGFVIEGIRIHYYGASQGAYFGGIVSGIVPASKKLHSALWIIHSVLALILIAIFPFTKLSHILFAPLNMIFRYSKPKGTMRPVDMDREYIGALKPEDLGKRDLLSTLACMKCGRCQESCPAYNSGTDLSPLYFIQDIRNKGSSISRILRNEELELVPETITQDGLWSCTTCRACVERCPVYVEPMELLHEIRRGLVDQGEIPPITRDVLQNIQKQGNPWGESKFKREKWTQGLEVQKAKDGEFDYLWYVGCANSFDTRCIQVSKQIVELFNNSGINFAILGREEDCCGNDPRRMGEEGLFQLLAEKNLRTFEKYGVKRIIATSPHCYNTLRNEYPEMGGEFEVIHITEFLNRLIREGKITPEKEMKIKVTYHDPCYLGRYNDIYDAPREIIEAIPGIELVEMPRNRENSFCCGGGGGNLWVEYPGDKRPSEIRVKEAVETGAELLVVSCPFCLIMFEDAIKTQKLDDKIRVVDIVELLMESLEG